MSRNLGSFSGTTPRRLLVWSVAVLMGSLGGCRATKAAANPNAATEPVAANAPAPVAPVEAPAAAPTTETAAAVATPAAPAPVMVELVPGLRLDRARGRVEFDGVVPIDAHNEKTPVVFLEWLVCTPDTKEHESLVLTKVKPSLIHAALLALGLEPGKPGIWDWTGKTLVAKPPTGTCVRVLVRTAQGQETDIRTWVRNLRTGELLEGAGAADERGFVFAGSNIVERRGEQWYQADREGGVVGLACFSTEMIAWHVMFNPDTGVEEAVWVANAAAVPAAGTGVTVIVERCK